MDPNRHSEYLTATTNSNERLFYNNSGAAVSNSSTGFSSTLNEMKSPHLQFYTSNKDLLIKKPVSAISSYDCTCNTMNSICNGCHTTTTPRTTSSEEKWSTTASSTPHNNMLVHTFNHYQNNSKNTVNSRYNSNISRNIAYWLPPEQHNQQSETKYPETNYNFKSTQAAIESSTSTAVNHFTENKDRFYDEALSPTKYMLPPTTSVNAIPGNVKIASYAPVYENMHPMHKCAPLESQRSLLNEHIINPSNTLAPTKQQTSPNYGRKCPQIYVPSPEPEQHATAHRSLYMETPQFSSEKFQTIVHNAIEKYTRRQSPQRQNPAIEYHVPKIHESPLQHDSEITCSRTVTKHQEMPIGHYTTRPPSYADVQNNSDPVNYYTQSGKYATAPELQTIIVKSVPLSANSHTSNHSAPSQYSKNSLQQPTQLPLGNQADNQLDQVNYVKLADEHTIYESYPQATSAVNNNSFNSTIRGLYHNPYNTPPMSIDSCCKDGSSQHQNYRGESPNVYPTKYGKLVQDSVITQRVSHHTLTPTPPPQSLQAPALRSYSTSNNPYYFGAPSPAAATAASPSPQAHQPMVYTPTPPPQPASLLASSTIQSSQSPHLPEYATTQTESSSRVLESSLLPSQEVDEYTQGYTNANGDICCTPRITTTKHSNQIPIKSINKQVMQSNVKKSNTPKPNYRVLIKELMMRNTEEELNLQIIRKTLNVDASRSIHNTPVHSASVIQELVNEPKIMPNVIHISTTPSIATPQPHIKQEPLGKSTVQSPLDLSIRTVKTKADSTEYKYRHANSVDYKHGLPRFDITPNFSAATISENLSVFNRHGQHSTKQSSNTEQVSLHNQQPAQQPVVNNSLIITSPHPTSDFANAQCGRPSVLVATNTAKALPTQQILACEQLPPDTSIMALSKAPIIQVPPHISSTPSQLLNEQHHLQSTQSINHNTYKSNNSLFVVNNDQTNPNYLGRKRHLQEYSNASNNNTQEAYGKQPRYQSLQQSALPPRAAETPVIAINKSAIIELELRRSKENSSNVDCAQHTSNHKQESATNLLTVTPIAICKQEPLTPTSDIMLSPTTTTLPPIKAERIRTKAELKGFTFTTPTQQVQAIIDTAEACSTKKLIKMDTQIVGIPNIPGLIDDFNTSNLLDLGWSNTCNNFVEQLLINNSKCNIMVDVQKIITQADTINIKQELSEDDLPVAHIAHKSNFLVNKDQGMQLISTTTSTASVGGLLLQKKMNKIDREKKRLVQEKRLAARLPDGSSSESDNELDKRKNDRQKKPPRKGKNRRLIPEICKKSRLSSERGSCTSVSELTEINTKNQRNQNRKMKYQKLTHETKLNKSLEHSEFTSKSDSDSKSITDNVKHESRVNTVKQTKSNEVEMNSKHNNSDQKISKSKQLKTKIALNTMTRSKRKKELELQLANSKVLRNEKIIRNSTTKIKRKYVRKFVATKETTATNTKESNVIGTRERLNQATKVSKSRSKLIQNNEKNKEKPAKPTKTLQSDVYMDLYRYKRALKIPPNLINFKDVQHMNQISISLNDFNRHRDTIEELSNDATKITATKTKTRIEDTAPHSTSIIDLLHSRVTNNKVGKPSRKSTKATKSNITSTMMHNFSETSQNTESTSVYELPLPTPLKKSDQEDNDNKRHFSIFDTKVLQTKTRTESKMQQKREIIREIFVGPDRPASAPPEVTEIDEGRLFNGNGFCSGDAFMSYEKYEQFVEQIDAFISQTKSRFARLGTKDTPTVVAKKEELDDTESASAIDADEKREHNDDDSRKSGKGEHRFHVRRKRAGKYLRRKGSSGFDYIRKKKKPSTTAVTQSNLNSINININQMHAPQIKMEKFDEDMDLEKVKTEEDICREIQKWVLNKGVGQSTMHKAARQGLIDVVVYCLDRIGMNPNQKDNAGYTPLHEACTHGWLEIARILLEYGANHSEAAQSGIRPLHGAIENDHEEVVRLLLSYGADPLLATYSGQTPLMLASSKVMRDILSAHLNDSQGAAHSIKPIRFLGPWEIFDPKELGYNIFENVPNIGCDMSRALSSKRKGSVVRSTNGLMNKKTILNNNDISSSNNNDNGETNSKTATATKFEKSSVISSSVQNTSTSNKKVQMRRDQNEDTDRKYIDEDGSGDGDMFEFEETDVLLPPLYLLKDEGSDKWVLLNDLCNLLKVKSKDTLLNKICLSSTATSSTNPMAISATAAAHKNLLREYKMSDFLEKATCLQLLCAGEKLNIGASKVVLIKYNESVKNLLGVKTILMKF